MPFLLYPSTFTKEQIWVKVYLEASCETVENTFQKLIWVFGSARQDAVSLAGIEYLPAVPVGYMKNYYLKSVSFPLPFSPYLFSPNYKRHIFKNHLLSKIRGFSQNSGKKSPMFWPLCVRKGGAKIPDALKEVRGQIWRLLTEENWCPG